MARIARSRWEGALVNRVRTSPRLGAGHVPRLPRAYVPRKRLWAQLEEATAGAVTLLVGPGGAGKTLGVSGWLRKSGRTTHTVWVQGDASWTPQRLLDILDEVASAKPDRSGPARLVVVDDAHQLPLNTVRALDARLNNAPDTFRVLLLSRWDLPFVRLGPELLGDFTMLRGELLRLDESESEALVAAHLQANAPEVAEAIAERTQGWCAAVVLTTRAIAVAPDPLAVARRYAEGDASVADRVASEVFAVLQPRQRHLLLCVANEPVVTPSLAIHLSHDPQAAEALANLEAMGVLVTRVSPDEHDPALADAEGYGERDFYTIHPLLAEVVRRRLSAGGVDVARARATVQRAVHLDVARGATEGAFRRLVGVGDHAGAAQLLADLGATLLLRGHGAEVNSFAVQHPSAIEVNPESWFAVALERWFTGEIPRARHWLDRIVTDPLPETPTTKLQVAAARVMRARLGLESAPDAVRHAEEVLVAGTTLDDDALVPHVLCELAITQNWLGDLDAAETNLTNALQLSRTHDLPTLTAVTLSHLAFTEYMQGREAACVELADEVLSMLDHLPWDARFSRTRAVLARQLSQFCEQPWHAQTPTAAIPSDLPLHAVDPTTRFWLRIRRSRLELSRGALSAAGRALDVPLDTAELPDHLAAVMAVERALLASITGDVPALAPLEQQLATRQAIGEAALVAGLRHDLNGDRRAAVGSFIDAADSARYRQPAVRALALTNAAQLQDDLGDEKAALDLLFQAAVATEVRRNAMPFLGWSRHGTKLSELLQRLSDRQPTPWVVELAASSAGRSGISTYFGPTTALPRERERLADGVIRPTLSPRERDVLYELARGSTYADIAANLFVSENTVKTHVSSLYGKLSVNRRSAALAAARSMNLL